MMVQKKKGVGRGKATGGRIGGLTDHGVGTISDVGSPDGSAHGGVPILGDTSAVMQVFTTQMRDFEARMMTNVTIQLESFKGQQTALVQEVSRSGQGSGVRLVPWEDVIPVASLMPQGHNAWLITLERYQKMRPPVFIKGNNGVDAETWKRDV